MFDDSPDLLGLRAKPRPGCSVVICLTLLGVVLTPVGLFAALASGGAGHGDYLWARLLFPYSMLLSSLAGRIQPPAVMLAAVQLPLYGLAGGLLLRDGGKAAKAVGIGLAIIHIAAFAFSFTDSSFS